MWSQPGFRFDWSASEVCPRPQSPASLSPTSTPSEFSASSEVQLSFPPSPFLCLLALFVAIPTDSIGAASELGPQPFSGRARTTLFRVLAIAGTSTQRQPKNELVFTVTQEGDGGFVAEALGESIFTQADTWDELRGNVREAVTAFYFDRPAPTRVRLHLVRDEVLA